MAFVYLLHMNVHALDACREDGTKRYHIECYDELHSGMLYNEYA